MKLSTVNVHNFRSLSKDFTLSLDYKITTLVGKSNVGKSNILDAIFNALNGNEINNTDLCSWLRQEPEDTFIELKFSIESDDKLKLRAINSLLADKNFMILKMNKKGVRSIFFEPEVEEKIVFIPTEGTAEYLSIFRSRIRKSLRSWKTFLSEFDSADLKTIEKSFNNLSKMVNDDKLLNSAENLKIQQNNLRNIRDFISNMRTQLDENPLVDYPELRGLRAAFSMITRDISAFITKVKFKPLEENAFSFEKVLQLVPKTIYVRSDTKLDIDDTLSISNISKANTDNFIKQLMILAGANYSIFTSGDDRSIRAELKRISKKLNKSLAKYWKQEVFQIVLVTGSDGQIDLDIESEEGHTGSIFQQSPGFRWFFSFVIKHLLGLQVEENIVLILDEPGIYLHAAAQLDLLERFENVGEKIQIIYTTHSPFLINKSFPSRIRSVGKRNQDDPNQGTFINHKPYHSASSNAWEPIRSAIGLPAGASLYVSSNNLIVEGISDQMYLVAAAQILNNKNREVRFDLNKVSICFAGSSLNQISLALFCMQEGVTCKILLDSDKAGKNVYKKLKSSKFPNERIILTSDISKIGGKQMHDIEDLFDDDFYHNLFLKAYSAIISVGDIPSTWEDIVKDVSPDEATSKKNKIEYGKTWYYKKYFEAHEKAIGAFDKVLIAKEIIDSWYSNKEEGSEQNLDKFGKLLSEIWEKGNSWD